MDTRRILIVDEEKPVRLTLKQVLEDAGYHITVAENGPVALDHLEETKWDLVLLDFRISKTNGFNVLGCIKGRHPELPIIIITVPGTGDQPVDMMREGSENFIYKPFTPQLIRTTVGQALARESPVSDETYDRHIEAAREGIPHKDLAQTRQHIQEAFVIDAKRPESFTLLGVLMQLQNQYRAALRYYRSALALKPGYKPAVSNRDHVSRSPLTRNPSDFRLE